MYYSNISGRAIVNTAIRSGMRVGGISIRFPEVFRSRPSFQRNSYVTCIVGSITLLLAVCISPTTSGQSVQMLAPDPTEELIWREEPANLVEEPPSEPFIPRVVIDPGHGYRDYGVVGVGGSREKDIVMDIALNIQELAKMTVGSKSGLHGKGTTRFRSYSVQILPTGPVAPDRPMRL